MEHHTPPIIEPDDDLEEVDYSQKWFVMAAVSIAIFMATVDGSIVNVALPTLVRELQTDFAIVQWVVLSYLLTQATLMLGVGRLADIKGKKPLYTGGFIVFTIGSVLCGLAPTVGWLIAFRVVQAVGASMVLALGLAIVTEAFPASERGKALGIAGSTVSVGIVVGPVLGGLLIEAFSWHWIFFVNLPVGIVGTLLALRYVPDVRPGIEQQFDLGGALALFTALLSLLLALTFGQEQGFDEPLILVLFGAFVLFLILFVFIERRHPQPMIDLRLFRNLLFTINLVTGFMVFVAIAGTIILIPFYLELVLGYSTGQVGLLLAVSPVALGVTAPISGALSDRIGTRPMTVLGLLMLVIGYFTISTLKTDTTVVGYILRFVPIGIGMGTFQSPNNSAVMGTVPRRHLGIASGLLAITRTLGQTTGIAVIGALWASRVYHYAGRTLEEGATAAEPAIQVAGLHDTFLILVGFITIALALGLWGLWRERDLLVARWTNKTSESPV